MEEDQRPAWEGALRGLGGVARQSALIDQGISKRDLARAVAAGAVMRVRRSWLALPDADPVLVAAARAGVVVSCITRAARLGLWVLAEDRPHVAAPSTSGGVAVGRADRSDGTPGDRKATVHWCAPLVPRPPGVLEDSIENTLALVARCQPRERSLVVWESALRQGHADRAMLEKLPLSAAARGLLQEATPFADSGLETIVPHRLRWLGVRMVAQAWILGHRVDLLIGERLVLQIDGGHHVGPQREKDVRHDAELMLRGYHVIRVGYHQVISDWPGVQQLVMTAIAQGLHRAG